MTYSGQGAVIAVVNLRPQDRFSNPKGYKLLPEHDVSYCSFNIDAPQESGIYWILVNQEIVYIGRAKNLHNRLSIQYGTVSPRHPYEGGQLQKCRTNAKINAAICGGELVSFRWLVCFDYVARERGLLKDPEKRPPWNRRS